MVESKTPVVVKKRSAGYWRVTLDNPPIKEIINQRVGLVPAADLASTQKRFFETLAWPESQARVGSLLRRGLQQRGDVELRLGHHLAAQ